MNNWSIFTDGSCRGNKNGGVGIVWIKNGEKVFEYSKGYKDTTNNQMELLAIGIALKSIKKSIDSLTIISDSEYALGCIFNEKWNPKKNVELINKIKTQLKETQKLIKEPIRYYHIDGHQKGDSEEIKWNNLADKLAQNESKLIL